MTNKRRCDNCKYLKYNFDGSKHVFICSKKNKKIYDPTMRGKFCKSFEEMKLRDFKY